MWYHWFNCWIVKSWKKWVLWTKVLVVQLSVSLLATNRNTIIIRIKSSDSEFEECLPLCEIVEVRKNDNGKHKRYYMRKRMNTKQFQPSNLEHKQLLLSDYEDTCKVDELDGIALLKSPNVNMYTADRKLYWNEIYLEIMSKPSFEQLKSYVNGMSFPQIAQPLYGDCRNDIDEVDPIGVDLLPNDTPSIFSTSYSHENLWWW